VIILVVTVACLVATGGATALWYAARLDPPPTPPEAKGDNLDPAVVSAVQVIRPRVLKNPHSAQAWGDLGEVFLANELEEQARVCFAEAERLDPRDAHWPYYQGGVLVNRGDREAALVLFNRTLERYPADGEAAPTIRLQLAESLLILGQADEAETHIRAALGREPDSARGHYDAALLAVSRQNWREARDHLLRCLGSPFAQQKARVQLTAACARLGDDAQADEYRAEAERLPPDIGWLDPLVEEYMHWAVVKRQKYKQSDELQAAGRFRDAAAVLRPLAADYPDDYLPQMELGKSLAQAGQFAEAETYLRRALRLGPDRVQTHYYLAVLLLKEGEELAGAADTGRAASLFREAADLAREALAIKSDYGYAHFALGLSLKHLGDRLGAEAGLRQALHCNPELAEPHFEFGKLLAEEGREAEARPYVEQALRLASPAEPWRKEAQDLLARLPGRPGAGKSPTP
jgi:tetratricopeptide (TPR) repeat protein